MKKLNAFFFPLEEGEELHPADFIWFYGGLSFFVVTTLSTVIATM